MTVDKVPKGRKGDSIIEISLRDSGTLFCPSDTELKKVVRVRVRSFMKKMNEKYSISLSIDYDFRPCVDASSYL